MEAPPAEGAIRASTPPRRLPPDVEGSKRSPPSMSPRRSRRLTGTSSGKRRPPTLPAMGSVPQSPVRERLSTGQVTQMERTFTEVGGGLEAGSQNELSIEQVKDFFRSEGWEADDKWAQQCFATFDTDGSGTISFDEFAQLVEQLAPNGLKSAKSTADDSLPAGTQKGDGGELQDVWEDDRASSRRVKMPWTKKDFDELSPKKKKICVGGMCLWCFVLVGFIVNLVLVVLYNHDANCPTPEEEPDLSIPTNPVRPPITRCFDHLTDKLTSDVVPAVDILLVTDQSNSMGPYNTLLSANLGAFIDSLNINSQDYTNHWQMIVANTHDGCNVGGIFNSNTQGLLSSYRASGASCPVGTITAPDSTKCTGRFETAVTSWGGPPGDGMYPFTEATLAAAVMAAENSGSGQCNAGFIRPEALLHVILVSDSTTPYETLLPRLKNVKGDAGLVQVSVFRNYVRQILPYDPSGALTPWGAAPAVDSNPSAVRPGAGYKEAAVGLVNGVDYTSEGVDADIMAPDWTHACYFNGQPADTPANQVHNPLPPVPVPAPIAETGTSVCGQALNAGNSGGDSGFLQTTNAGGGGFRLRIAYNAYSRRDRFIVWKNTATTAGLLQYGVALTLPISGQSASFVTTNNDHPPILLDNGVAIGTRRNATQVCEVEPNCIFDSGCVNNVQAQPAYGPLTSPWLDLSDAENISLVVVPNCLSGVYQAAGGTGWTMDIQCQPPPPPPPAPPPRTCPTAPLCTAALLRAGTLCYRNYITELAREVKVFGHYVLPQLAPSGNHSNVRISLDNVWINGPKRLSDGAINPACGAAGTATECLWDFAIDTVVDSTDSLLTTQATVVQFDRTKVDFRNGQAVIGVDWDQSRPGGCVTVTFSLCEEKEHSYVAYVLFILLMLMICCGTYGAIARKRKTPPPIILMIKTFNDDVHEVEANMEMSIGELKALLNATTHTPTDEMHIFNEAFSDQQLTDGMTLEDCQCDSTTTFIMMVTWTIFVRQEMPSDELATKAAALAELGIDADDLAVKIHTIEGVERHWKVESVMLKIEELTGVPVAHQQLSLVTISGQIPLPLKEGDKLPDHPDIHNRATLVLTDTDPERKVRLAQQKQNGKSKRMNANNVVSMAKMFGAGQVPGASLSSLKEESVSNRKKELQAKYSSYFQKDLSRKAGLSVSHRATGNLMARAQRARHAHHQSQSAARP
jgi:hypothetical protein